MRAFILAVGLAVFGLISLPVHADSFAEAGQLLKAGQHAKALDQIDRYLATKPKDAQGRFLKGIILTGLNKQSEAIAIFQKLTEDFPELPEPYNNLAVIYAQQRQYEKAKQALELAIRTHPAYTTAHENLGDIYSRLASQAYGKALQLDSSNASAQTKLSMINELVGNGKVGAGKTATPPAAPALPAAPIAPAPTVPVKPPVPVIVASTDKADSKPIEVKPLDAKPAASKPAEVKPTPAPVPPPKPEPAKTDDVDNAVTTAVDGWLAAWAKKDVKTYLAYYAPDFETPKGRSRKVWEAERHQRVGKPGKIEVGRDKLSIKPEGNDKVVVRFRQDYKSPGFSASSGKTLVLVKHNGKWLIQQEMVGG